MERNAVILLLLLFGIASCRGDKNATSSIQPSVSIASNPVPVDPNSSTTNHGPGEPLTTPPQSTQSQPPAVQSVVVDKSSKDRNETIKSQIIAAIKTLDVMLSANASSRANPLRMEGIVITNNTPANVLMRVIPESLLFNQLYLNTGRGDLIPTETQEKNAQLMKQILTGGSDDQKLFNLDYRFRVRLKSRDMMDDYLKAETDKVYNSLVQYPERYKEEAFPISILISTNFYEKNATIMPKTLYVKFLVDEEKLNNSNSNFLTFGLIDRSLDQSAGQALIGKIDMQHPENNKIENYRLVLQFQNTVFGAPVEQIAVLQMTPVTLLPPAN